MDKIKTIYIGVFLFIFLAFMGVSLYINHTPSGTNGTLDIIFK